MLGVICVFVYVCVGGLIVLVGSVCLWRVGGIVWGRVCGRVLRM